jgi:hypothetical protein
MKRSDKHQEAVVERLSVITELSRADLIEGWEATYGGRPPKGISRRLLEFSAAYIIQVKAYGGLKLSARRQLERVEGKKSVATLKKASSGSKLSVGARLVREWHGRTHTLDVIDSGLRYDGRDYKSLSQIAREITGARWSGPRFFGL